jgi:hypothetical protein
MAGSCEETPGERDDWNEVYSSLSHQTDGIHSPMLLPHILSWIQYRQGKSGISASEQLTAELLQQNHRLVEPLILVHDDLLVTAITNHNTGISPGEIVHTPERVHRQEETVHRIPAE